MTTSEELVERLRATSCVQIDPERQAIRPNNPDGPEAADEIESLRAQLAGARGAALEEAADTKPPRSAGRPPDGKWGGWYQVGWDHAVIAYEDAIRNLDGGGGK